VAARVPLDVDLEDRIIFGLTPQRFGYLVLGALAAFASWSQHSWPEVLRAAAGLPFLVLAAAAAWGRWRGRAFDGYLMDVGRYAIANYEVRITVPRRPRRPRPPQRPVVDAPRQDRDPALCCTSPGLDELA
jgi:hypothetical protein